MIILIIKTSSSGAIPDWVDREVWEDYKKRPEYADNKIYKAGKAIENGIVEPIVRTIFGASDKKLNWEDVEEMVVKLAENVKKYRGPNGSKFSPNYIVGLERGGALYSRRLAEEFDIDHKDPEKVAKIKMQHYHDALGNNMLTQWIPMLFYKTGIEDKDISAANGKNVLLADDDVATGKTMVAAKRHYMDSGAKKVKSAVLCGNQSKIANAQRKIIFGNNNEPDFFASPDAYGVYPWYQLHD